MKRPSIDKQTEGWVNVIRGIPRLKRPTTLEEAHGSEIPKKPWLLSKQYEMTFVLSQDNEIIIGDAACKYMGEHVLKHIVDSVNRSP